MTVTVGAVARVGRCVAAAALLAGLVSACDGAAVKRSRARDRGPGQTTTTTPAPTTTTTAPPFVGSVEAVAAADLAHSWRAGCPVAPSGLRLLRLRHWGFDNQAHDGVLVIHASVADEVLGIFGRLYEARFPIRQMQSVDDYEGSDDASMAADNTSGFNCRLAVASGPPHWSRHAYGLAIDVNPVENPYVFGGDVLPPAGAEYVDRSNVRPGMAVPGGVLLEAFAEAGWEWGGTWAEPDYQHFAR